VHWFGWRVKKGGKWYSRGNWNVFLDSFSGAAGALVGEMNVVGVMEAEAEAEEAVVVVVAAVAVVVVVVVVEDATGDIDVPVLVKEGDGVAILTCLLLSTVFSRSLRWVCKWGRGLAGFVRVLCWFCAGFV
jgi:hypothetical protein